MTRTWLVLLLLLAHLLMAAAEGKAVDFKVDDFPGLDDRDTINRALEAMRAVAGPKTLHFSQRDYRIAPRFEQPFSRQVGADGLRDLTIEGHGARLLIIDGLDAPDGYAIAFRDFSGLRIRNLHLGYRPLPFVQGRITAVDQERNHVEVLLDPAFATHAALRKTRQSAIWCRVATAAQPLQAKAGNPSWMGVACAADGRLQATVVDGRRLVLRAGGFDRRTTLDGSFNWQIGDAIVIWKRGPQDGWFFEQGQDLQLDTVTVDSALHFAIKLRGILGAKLLACEVRPVADGMLSGCADGIDVQQSRDVLIAGCRVVACGDDMISFLNHGPGHGWNGEQHEQALAPPYPETNAGVTIRSCELLGGNRNGILLLASQAVVEGNLLRGARQYGLKFSGEHTRIVGNTFERCAGFAAYRHIADELDTGVICSDEWTQRDTLIEGNVVRDWQHMPALLLKSLHGAEVRRNRFEAGEAALLEHPFNAYLTRIPAVCVTVGRFKGAPTTCSEVRIVDNVVVAPGVWRSFDEALVINGVHQAVTTSGNTAATAVAP